MSKAVAVDDFVGRSLVVAVDAVLVEYVTATKVSVSFGENGCIVRSVSELVGMFTDGRMVSVASVVPAAKSKRVSFDKLSLGEGAADVVAICCSSSMFL
jgi:hypothetical protein